MKQKIVDYLDNVIVSLLFIVAAVTPILFINQTTEFFEMPKLIFLVFSTVLLLGLWIFSWILKGKIVITRTPLDIPLLALLSVVLISTFFSITRYTAIYGNFPKVHESAVAWVIYILLYFVTVSQLKTVGKLKNFLYVVYGSVAVVAIVTLLSFFKLYLPFDFAKSVGFTPTGSTFSTVALLLMLLPLPLLSLAKLNKYMPVAVAMPLAILFSAVTVLTGSMTHYVILVLVFAVTAIAAKPHQMRKAFGLFIVPVLTTVLVFTLAYVPFPGNFIQGLENNFPKEVQLPLAVSWKVSASSFRDAPFFGTGPSSYLFNFATYKPAEFNTLPFWGFGFDTAANEMLQVLGTLGFLGFLSFFALSLSVVLNAWKGLMAKATLEEGQDASRVLIAPLAISGVIGVVLFFVHATTLVSLVATLFVFAALMMSQRQIREKVMEFSIGIKALTHDNKQFDLFPVIIFIVYLVVAVPVVYKLVNVVSADYYHRLALSQANKNGTLTYTYLQKAESINPEIDLYRVDMAQTNFALANALVLQKGPTKENPKGSLTDNDKKTIQTLLAQSINEGRVAVALSPRSARNWEVLGSIYRNITGVAENALSFSLDAYGNSIQRDPLNPALRLSVGGIYYSIKNYDMAVRFFTDAINLKPDYANAYYNLALTLDAKADLTNATLVEQQLVNILQKNPNSADYKAAVKYLNDLKTRLAENNKQAQEAKAPAGETGSALQNEDLEDVTVGNLNNPPETVVPSPIKSNPNANIPQPTVTPARTQTVTPTPAR